MSTSDSLDEDDLATGSKISAFPVGKTMSSQVDHLTSTLKVVHVSKYFICFSWICDSVPFCVYL